MDIHDTELQKSLSFKLHHVVRLMHQLADKVLQDELEISFSQYFVLKVTGCFEGSSQREVAGRLDITPAAISRHIDGLCERGLMVKTQEPDNRRQHNIQLTKAGIEKVTRAQQLLSSRFDVIVEDSLSQSEIAQFGVALDAIASALQSDKAIHHKGA